VAGAAEPEAVALLVAAVPAAVVADKVRVLADLAAIRPKARPSLAGIKPKVVALLEEPQEEVELRLPHVLRARRACLPTHPSSR